MIAADSAATVRRFYDEVICRQRLDAIDALLTPDFTHNGEARGRDGQRQGVTGLFAAFPDVQAKIDDLVAVEDRVAVRKTWNGTQRGPFMGEAPTGKRATWMVIAILQVVNGQIAAAWVTEDDLGLLQQLGVGLSQHPAPRSGRDPAGQWVASGPALTLPSSLSQFWAREAIPVLRTPSVDASERRTPGRL